jgi:hypothetical protein
MMLRSKEQDTRQEILVRQYPHGKGPIDRGGGMSEYALIRIIKPANLRSVSFFLTKRGTESQPVDQDIDSEGDTHPCAIIAHQEHEGRYTLNSPAAQNSCSVIKKSGDLSCAGE